MDALRSGEAGGRRLPGPDGAPPVAVIVVPAGVDDEVLRAGLGGGVDQGQQLGRGRVAHQAVHVVVEDDRQPAVVGVRAAGGPAVAGEAGESDVGAAARGQRERHGHGTELGARLQRVAPAVVGVVRAVQCGVRRVVAHPALPAPAAPVVFDLPQPGAAGLAVRQAAHRQVAAAGPHALSGDDAGAAAGGGVEAAAPLGRGHAQRLAVPAAFGEPLVLRPQQVGVVQLHRVAPGEAAGHERGDRFQVQRPRSLVAQQYLAAQHRKAVRGSVERLGGQTGLRVVKFDGEHVPVAVPGRAVGAVA